MNLNAKQYCIDSLAPALARSSRWRTSKAKAFCGDPRNAKAATRLAQLSDDASHMTDAEWLELAPYFNWASEDWPKAVSAAAREVGFKRHPQDFLAFVENLVAILETQKVAA